jgi:Carboxypeptidase regulatory-like domain
MYAQQQTASVIRQLVSFSRRRTMFLALSLLLCVILGAPTLLFAQTSADGTIHGQVVDGSGAVLAGVNITAHSPAVGGTFKAVSDQEGNYRLTELPQGTDYTVEAEAPGFEKFVRLGLIVRAGLNVTADVSLKCQERLPSLTHKAPSRPLISVENCCGTSL